MATSHPSGAIKKQPLNRKSVFTPQEYPPVCGKAIPAIEETEITQTNEDKEKDFKFEKWHSLLKLKQEIENIETKDKKSSPKSIKSTENLTPRSKSIVMPKINQKLNIDSSKTVFKDLVSINVNDVHLPKKPFCIKSKYKVTATNKIPVPDLADFLDPLPPLDDEVSEREDIIELEDPGFNEDLLATYKDYAGIKDRSNT